MARIAAYAVCFVAFIAQLAAMPSYDDVLLVIKSGDAASAEIGAYFQAARKIPAVNVATIALSGSGATKVSMALRDQFVTDIKNYIDANGLAGKINYIVLSSGFPTKGYDNAGSTAWSILDVYIMHRLSAMYPTASWCTNNPYSYIRKDNYTNREKIKFTKNKYGYYIVTRLDGPSRSAIKKMIDNFGPAVFDSAKNVKYVIDSMAQYTGSSASQHHPEIQANIEARGGTFVLWQTNNGFVHDCSDINFLDADWVVGADGSYSRGSVISTFPHQWKRLQFKPGSVMNTYRSFPTGDGYFATSQFGLHSFNGTTITSMMQTDGSDFEIMNMNSIVVNPEDHTLWCAAALHALHDGPSSHDHLSADYLSKNGAGVAVYNKSGTLITRHTKDTGLLCNAVYTLTYDKYNHRMWAGTFSGVSYYDLVTRTWSTPAGLTHTDGARVAQIYVDPTTSGQLVYVTYINGSSGWKVPNRLGSWHRVFEYNVAAGTTTVRNLGISDAFYSAQVAKSEADILWLRYATNKSPLNYHYIRKVKISTGEKLYELAFNNIGGIDHTPSLSHSGSGQNIIVSVDAGVTNIYSPIGTTNAAVTIRNGVLRIVDGAAPTAEIWGAAGWWSGTSSTMSNVIGDKVIQNPLHPDKVYLITREHNVIRSASGKVIEFSAANTAGTELKAGSTSIINANAAAFDDETDGRLWFVRYQYASTGQFALYELYNYGLTGAMGGFSHDGFSYDGQSLSAYSLPAAEYIATTEPDYHLYSSESGGSPTLMTMYQLKSMAMLLLDGFYFAEARFGSLAVYPTQGSGGHYAHMIVMDPKAAPYAPRVDLSAHRPNVTESIFVAEVYSPNTVNKSAFLTASINADTVKLYGPGSAYIPADSISVSNKGSSLVIRYDARTRAVTSGTYTLVLSCGVDGIKNAQGASLVNSSATEFKDEVSLTFSADLDHTAPTVSGFPANFTTNRAFTLDLTVDEDFGYWSTNGVTYTAFAKPGTSVSIRRTTTFSCYGRDAAGNTSPTQTRTYTIITRRSPSVVSASTMLRPLSTAVDLSLTLEAPLIPYEITYAYALAGSSTWVPITGTNLLGVTAGLTGTGATNSWIVRYVDTSKKCHIKIVTDNGEETGEPYIMSNVNLSSIFALRNDLSQAAALGNPFRGGDGIEFVNIMAGTSASIYTIAGKCLATVPAGTGTESRLLWNVRTKDGAKVAPGVYVCVLRSSWGSKVLKVMVLR